MTPIEEVKLSIETAREGMRYGEALDRLMKNRDFNLIIQKGFLTDEVLRLTELLAHPATQDREDVHIKLYAISYLTAWMTMQRQAVRSAHKSFEENSRELDLLMQEDAEEE